MYDMFISLTMLYERLHERFPAVPHIENDGFCIRDIRLQPPGSAPEKAYVYLCRGEDWPGETQAQTVLWHEDDYIEIDAPWLEAANGALSALEEFRALNRRLNAAILDPEPFQRVTEIAAEVFMTQSVITNNVFRVLGISGEMAGSPWAGMKENNVSPPNYVGYFTHPSRFQIWMSEPEPLQQKLPYFCLWKAVLRVNCFFGGKAQCRLCLHTAHANNSPGAIQLLECFGKAVEQIAPEAAEPYFQDGLLLDRFFTAEGEFVPGDNPLLDKITLYIGNKPFYLCQFQSLYREKTASGAYWLYSYLENLNNQSCAWMHENSILYLIQDRGDLREYLTGQLMPLLREIGFGCMVSNVCRHISEIRECLRQIKRLDEQTPVRCPGISFFEDKAKECLMAEIASRADIQSWLYAGLHTLREYDARENTALFQTLACLAKNNFVQNVTAEELYIHRNSLQYRVKRIEQLLGCDLSDAETRWFLTLSVLLYREGGG